MAAEDLAANMRIKHLEMLQAVIARLSNHGASIKNYCLTITTAACGAAVTLQRPLVAAIALLPVVVFWALDTQYLRTERRFRIAFERVRSEDWITPPTFNMTPPQSEQIGYWSTASSWAILPFYLTIAAGVLCVVVIAGALYGRFV